MSLLDVLLNAGGGSAISELSRRFGLSEEQTRGAIGALAPAIRGGVQRNTATTEGANDLLRALSSGHHRQYLEDPTTLGNEETVRDGNGILGHLFGSKEVSRKVAQKASSQTGLGEDTLKRMLPVVAAMVMGALSSQANTSGAPNQGLAPQAGGLPAGLSSFLDADRDGSILDDVLGFVSRLGGR